VNEAALFYELTDRLDRIERRLETLSQGGVTQLWISKRELARELGVSVRWIEYRMREGLPHREIAGRVVFRVSSVEAWLRARGLLKEAQ
jgi:hypothetical protein